MNCPLYNENKVKQEIVIIAKRINRVIINKTDKSNGVQDRGGAKFSLLAIIVSIAAVFTSRQKNQDTADVSRKNGIHETLSKSKFYDLYKPNVKLVNPENPIYLGKENEPEENEPEVIHIDYDDPRHPGYLAQQRQTTNNTAQQPTNYTQPQPTNYTKNVHFADYYKDLIFKHADYYKDLFVMQMKYYNPKCTPEEQQLKFQEFMDEIRCVSLTILEICEQLNVAREYSSVIYSMIELFFWKNYLPSKFKDFMNFCYKKDNENIKPILEELNKKIKQLETTNTFNSKGEWKFCSNIVQDKNTDRALQYFNKNNITNPPSPPSSASPQSSYGPIDSSFTLNPSPPPPPSPPPSSASPPPSSYGSIDYSFTLNPTPTPTPTPTNNSIPINHPIKSKPQKSGLFQTFKKRIRERIRELTKRNKTTNLNLKELGHRESTNWMKNPMMAKTKITGKQSI